MNPSYTCQPCRQKLARTALQRLVPRASFISLSTPSRKTNDSSADVDEQQVGSKKQSKSPGFPQEQRRRPPRPGDPGDQLEALFETTINPPASGLPKTKSITSLAPYKHAETLKKMVASDEYSAVLAWEFFVKHFGPEAWENESINRASTPSYIYTRGGGYSGQALLHKVMRAKSMDISVGPSFTEITKVYFQLEILHGNDWTDMMCVLLDSIIKRPLREESVKDLMGAWNIITHRDRKRANNFEKGSTRLDWSHMVAVSDRDIIKDLTKHGIKFAFAHLSPTFSTLHRDDIALVALATFSVLTQYQDAPPPTVKHAVPFLDAITRVVNLSELHLGLIPLPHGRHGTPILSYVTRNWANIKEQAAQFINHPVHFSEEHRSERGKPLLVTHHKMLEDALRRKNIPHVDSMWEDAESWPIHHSAISVETIEMVPRGKLSAGMCNHFIQVYMALRCPNRAIDVWNHMIKSGLIPNLATWDSMLTGCKISRDVKALEEVWARLQGSGLTPDIHCWTSRVSGLAECGKFEMTLRALGDMGRLWLMKAREQYGKDKRPHELHDVGNVKGATKPTIEVVNAAISGLLRRYRSKDTQQVLAWAGTFGIQPNLVTYNTLLRPLVRDGQTSEAMAILKHMKTEGFEADVVTFTTILEETFRHSAEYTIEEQKEIIANIFNEMEGAGVKANTFTYGRLIYQLLQTNLKDLTAVNAVLERMTHDGLHITPQIYTMIVEYYFRQPTVDLDGVRAIIERVKSEEAGDDIFWDRVINGYAIMGDTATAMRILGQVTSTSVRQLMRTGWPTLDIVLSALIKNDQWDVARTFVRDIKLDSGGPIPANLHGKDGQHKFWHTVEDLGLLDA